MIYLITVTNETEFKNAISNKEPEILVENDINLTSQTSIGYAVSIKGKPGVSLFWANPSAARPNMLIVTAAGELAIESLILDAGGRNGTLVQMTGGKFTMNDGSILRNVTGRTSQNAVKLGAVASPSNATFTMNGGLITGIDSADAVFCSGGTVIMNNDAAISDNMSAGISMADAGGVRSALTMTGRSRISGNQSKQIASAGLILGTDVIMGVNEGDAPAVTGNKDTVYAVGGWILTDKSTLTMRYGAEISGNDSIGFGGGLAVQGGSTILMRDNAVIKNNKAAYGAGVILATNGTITMEDQAQIFDNISAGRGGGLELQSGSSLQMKGNAAIHDNASGGNGAGIYQNVNTTAIIGAEDSSPRIYNNEATGLGGGIYISKGSALDLTGQTEITGNIATEGKDIYKRGTLNLSKSPNISGGLFFDDLQGVTAAGSSLARAGGGPSAAKFQIPLDSPENISIELLFTEETAEDGGILENDVRSGPAMLLTSYSDNVPVIAGALTSGAYIQLEASGYVSPPKVPLAIADKGTGYAQLTEADRAVWRIPASFGPGYVVILNDARDQVLIDYETYRITYKNLNGAENPNPDSYKLSDLPIILADPGPLTGYAFAGWYDAQGERITVIPAGTTGGISLTATWEKLFLTFEPNAPCVCNIPNPIPVEQEEKVRIPLIVPCRPCYHFVCWNIPDSGTGKVYFPGDIIIISNNSIALYAQWQPDYCRCCGKDKKDTGWQSPTKCIVSWE